MQIQHFSGAAKENMTVKPFFVICGNLLIIALCYGDVYKNLPRRGPKLERGAAKTSEERPTGFFADFIYKFKTFYT